VGTGRAEHSGLHEAMIGLGGLLGPLVGAAGARVLGGVGGAAGAALAVAGLATGAVSLALRPRGGAVTCSSRG